MMWFFGIGDSKMKYYMEKYNEFREVYFILKNGEYFKNTFNLNSVFFI